VDLDWYGPYPAVLPPIRKVLPQTSKASKSSAVELGTPFETDCRSGRRLTEGVHPFIHDFILGFRVVLVTEP
jgi:hypothetical protein